MGGTYKMIEIVGTSTKSFADAAQSAVKDAAATVRGMAWFEVVEQRGRIDEGKVVEFQVKVAVGFKIER